MANIDELVEEYYNKLLTYSKFHGVIHGVSGPTETIHYALRKIIEQNNDYLLTDSLLDFLTRFFGTAGKLEKFAMADYYRIDTLMNYFEHMIHDYNNGLKSYRSTFLIIEDDMKEAIINVANRIKKIYEENEVIHNRLYDIARIYYVVLAYYTINGRKDNIDELCDIFTSDPYLALDRLYFYGVRDKDDVIADKDKLISYVFNKIETNQRGYHG